MEYIVPGFYLGRVSDFFNKIRTRPGPASGFFLKNPYPTLFLIGPGKIRPIRVGLDRIPADRVKIAIPRLQLYQAQIAHIYVFLSKILLLLPL